MLATVHSEVDLGVTKVLGLVIREKQHSSLARILARVAFLSAFLIGSLEAF